jgi:hypothetical protein
VETLNSMNEKNKGKKATKYAGELLIITASDVVFNKFMNACQLYESGGLINLDTCHFYRDDDRRRLWAITWYRIHSNIFAV